jgi:hypothetical protein
VPIARSQQGEENQMSYPALQAAMAELTYLVSGSIGIDWRSGMPFILSSKGDSFSAVCRAVEALRAARGAIDALQAENMRLRAMFDASDDATRVERDLAESLAARQMKDIVLLRKALDHRPQNQGDEN